LTAADILGRTRGSVAWGSYYVVFALAAATHGAIGVRSIAMEWGGVRGRHLDLLMWIFGIILAGLGLRAVYAVVLG
jgi:fumarate reductase subunit C